MNNRSADTSNAGSAGSQARKIARKIVWAQLVVTVLVALGFGVASGSTGGLSEFGAALTGGLINVVANLLFIRRWFATYGIESPAQRVLGFYVAEVAKLLMTVTLLALAIGVFKLSFLPLFVAFVATLLVFWLALSPRFWNLVGGRS